MKSSTPAEADGRRFALVPSSTLPLVYFAGAHAALASALGLVAARPGLAAPFPYDPRVIALVHLVTIGWISGSIMGALYIVAPLAMGIPLRAGRADVAACAAFWSGTLAMVWGFWSVQPGVVAAGSPLVIAALGFVGVRVLRATPAARLPGAITLHLGLAFANVVIAGAAGTAIALGQRLGLVPWPPLSMALAHAHLAALGWVVMMIMGVGYRLIPMVVPAAMPGGRGLAASALLLGAGAAGLAVSLLLGATTVPWALVALAGLAAFFVRVARLLGERRPRPVELPRPDWSTVQTFAALAYAIAAGALGARILWGGTTPALAWAYGAAGLLGFMSQVVVGIGGRLLPMLAWYRALSDAGGAPPEISVHTLIDPRLARLVCLLWNTGLPVLIAGLVGARPGWVALGSSAVAAGVVVNGWHVVTMMNGARRARAGRT